MKRARRFLIFTGGAIGLLFVAFLVWEFSPPGRRDTCLDGGGRWLENSLCEGGIYDGEDLKFRLSKATPKD
jgi:hypothetical protein